RIDVARTQIHDPNKRLSLDNSEHTEVIVVRQDDAPMCMSEPQQSAVVGPGQIQLPHTPDIVAFGGEARHDVRMDVLVREQGIVPQLHGATSAVRSTSFFSAAAA